METKAEIRKRMLEERNRLTDDEIAQKSGAIVQKVLELPEYIKAQNILLYASFKSEVETRGIFEDAIANGKRVYFPKPERSTNNMEFYQASSLNQLEKGYMGILEPPEKEELRYRFNPEEDTLAIVPGVAFDASGNRIGYGKGYYDKFLSGKRQLSTVALAFSCQIADELPCEAYDIMSVSEASGNHKSKIYDVKMDKIVTEEIVFSSEHIGDKIIMTIREKAAAMKLDSPKMAAVSANARNNALLNIKNAMLDNKNEIFAANARDLSEAEKNNIPEAVVKRLKFSEAKLIDAAKGLENLAALPDLVYKTQFVRELDEGLSLVRESCPIGVIGVIFEARPDALVQIASLCIKSGNCAILKGGSETKHTNKVLFELIYKAAIKSGLPENCLFQAEQRDEIASLLECHESVDLIIPRGSNSFVQYIMENTKIPVLGHADGICHIYVDSSFDIKKAIPVIIDAKTQYTAACNAVETLLVHKDAVDMLMPELTKAFRAHNIELRATREIADKYGGSLALEEDFATEYLDLIISAKTVENIDEAINHINKYGSHHTDCIITEDIAAAGYFMQMVDSAGVYQNCSTRFADGFRYGFGAEVGISTGKIHARGPVGIEGLLTYKYKLFGSGHIVGDYASGKREFHFKDISTANNK